MQWTLSSDFCTPCYFHWSTFSLKRFSIHIKTGHNREGCESPQKQTVSWGRRPWESPFWGWLIALRETEVSCYLNTASQYVFYNTLYPPYPHLRNSLAIVWLGHRRHLCLHLLGRKRFARAQTLVWIFLGISWWSCCLPGNSSDNWLPVYVMPDYVVYSTKTFDESEHRLWMRCVIILHVFPWFRYWNMVGLKMPRFVSFVRSHIENCLPIWFLH